MVDSIDQGYASDEHVICSMLTGNNAGNGVIANGQTQIIIGNGDDTAGYTPREGVILEVTGLQVFGNIFNGNGTDGITLTTVFFKNNTGQEVVKLISDVSLAGDLTDVIDVSEVDNDHRFLGSNLLDFMFGSASLSTGTKTVSANMILIGRRHYAL